MNVTKNYDEMMKYYSMAIKKGNTKAICNLGYYHENITKNHREMIKCAFLAIKKGKFFSENKLNSLLDLHFMNSADIIIENVEHVNGDIIKKVNKHLFSRDPNDFEKDECCICCELAPIAKTKCTKNKIYSHAVCLNCLDKINKCPLCRRNL